MIAKGDPMRRLLASLTALVVAALFALGVVGAAHARAASAPPPPAPTATPTYHPTLQLSATQGTRDQALVVVASDFPAHAPLTLSWDGGALAQGTTDDAGYLALRIAVPHDAPDGPHEVRAAGPAHTAAGAAFTVAAPPAATYHPALAASPAQALPGARLVALASGFPPGGALTLSWDGTTLAQATADASGAARLDAALPTTGPGATAGPHEVRVAGPAHTTASAPVTVLDPAQVYHPALVLDAAQGQRGAHVALAATGFAPGQDVRFYWDRGGGPDLGTVRADTSGNADHTVTIGQGFSVTDGAHRLYAAGSSPTLAASAFYTVQPTPPACGGLSIPLPFVSPLCLDPLGALGSWIANGATAGATAVGALVAKDLTTQQDYTQITQLQPVFGTMQDLARDLFLVLFLVGALTWYTRRLGLGPSGEAATQMVEGGLGLALTLSLPHLMRLYIAAVNDASGMILADPNNQGAAAIGELASHLIGPALLTVITGDPIFLLVVVGFIVVFVVLLVLIAITRTIGTLYGAAVYLAAPVSAICMVTPLTRSVAAAWARLWFSLTLWGVSYAVALVSVRAMVAAFGGNGLQSLALALAGALMLYGAPRLGDALLGGGASRALGIGNMPLLGTAIRMGLAAATGGTAGAAVAEGSARTAAAIPSDPSITPVPNASVSEIASLAPPINAEWGLIE